jgi:hypothetical protein
MFVEKIDKETKTAFGTITVNKYFVTVDQLVVTAPHSFCFNFEDHDYQEERVYMVYSQKLGVVTPCSKTGSIFLGAI